MTVCGFNVMADRCIEFQVCALTQCSFLPAGGTDEGEGDELVPERVILRYGLCAHQGLEAGIIGQVTDLTGVGSHLCWLCSARLAALHCFFTRHMPKPGTKKMLYSLEAQTINNWASN